MGIWGQQMPGLPNEGPQQLPALWQDEGQCKGTHSPLLQKADPHGNAAATAENTMITLTLKEWKGSNFKKLKYQAGVYHSHTLQSRFDSNAIFDYDN